MCICYCALLSWAASLASWHVGCFRNRSYADRPTGNHLTAVQPAGTSNCGFWGDRLASECCSANWGHLVDSRGLRCARWDCVVCVAGVIVWSFVGSFNLPHIFSIFFSVVEYVQPFGRYWAREVSTVLAFPGRAINTVRRVYLRIGYPLQLHVCSLKLDVYPN